MISIELKDDVLAITIRRPEKKNALLPVMYKDMAIALESVLAQEAKVVLIQGCNGVFTSGNDLSSFAHATEQADIEDTHRFMMALMDCPIPVVAKVQGLAIGIGTTMLLHCDFVFANSNTKFAMPFINLALVPEYASSFILPKISGRLLANKLLMLGDVFDANTAKDAGLVSELIDDGIDEQVDVLLKCIASKPQQAMVQTKKLLNSEVEKVREHINRELALFIRAMNSAPAKEAFSAFLEKRPVDHSIFR
ncbi:enoyl-CoA hydratase-related protein [Agaribacter marinus]|uniref:Enoyl-CoA hydratase n=1 Tax=Agaribacter marinus TaxID=1431249 RepID=A0AA37SXA8_9ALTE|nr:enoyl-CoA hydratase-related protein [Agaribacter marinus]GLR69885.1 enoyl-CoA hydratase [Agaribacter marinus]